MLQEDLFSDMCFAKGSITEDYMLRNGKHITFETGLSINEQYFRFIVEDVVKYDAYTDVNSRKIVVSKKHIKNNQQSYMKCYMLTNSYLRSKNLY